MTNWYPKIMGQKPKRPRELRGWHIYKGTFHGREHWTAKRHGVSMNTNSYDGIVNMILTKEKHRQR